MCTIPEIDDGLGELPLLKRVAFGASCCERLLPNYLAFSLIEDWGDFYKLRRILDTVWAGLSNESLLTELNDLPLNEIIALAPDTEDFTSVYTSLAGDSVASVAYTLEAFRTPAESSKKISLVSQVAQNTLYEYLSVVNDPEAGVHVADGGFADSIFSYPIMKAEIEKQTKDLSSLRDCSCLSPEVVSELSLPRPSSEFDQSKEVWSGEGLTNTTNIHPG